MSRPAFPVIVQTALKALNLAEAHSDALAPRLPEGTVEGLRTDITALGVAIPTFHVAHAQAKATTVAQAEACARGHKIISAVRGTVRRSGAPRAACAAYGVGTKCVSSSVKQVRAGAQMIVDRATAQPAEAAALGILPKDIDALRQVLVDVASVDGEQEQRRALAPATRRERDAIARRIVKATGRIAAAGTTEFATDQDLRASFEALIGAGNPKPKSPPAPEPGPSPAPTNA